MPDRGISIWTPFTADRSIMAGGEALARGIGTGAAAIAEGISERMKEEKRLVADAKRFEASFKDDTDLQKSTGLTPVQFGALSAEEKIATYTGASASRVVRQQLENAAFQKRKQESELASALANRKVAGNMMRALADEGAAGQSNEEVMRGGGGRSPLGDDLFDASVARSVPGLDPMELAVLQGSAESGAAMEPAVVAQILRNRQERTAGGAGPLKPAFTDIPETNTVLAQFGKAAFPVAKTAGAASAEEMVDERGEVVGHAINVPGARSRFQPLKPVKAQGVSSDFHEALGNYSAGLESPKPERVAASRRLIKSRIDQEHIGKGLTDEQRDDYYEMYEIPLKDRPKKASRASGPTGPGKKGGAALGTRDNPHKTATPEEASKLDVGEWFETPDGRLIQRK